MHIFPLLPSITHSEVNSSAWISCNCTALFYPHAARVKCSWCTPGDFCCVPSSGRVKCGAGRGHDIHSSGAVTPALCEKGDTLSVALDLDQMVQGQGGKPGFSFHISSSPDLWFWSFQLLCPGSQIKQMETLLVGFISPLLPGSAERYCTSDYDSLFWRIGY